MKAKQEAPSPSDVEQVRQAHPNNKAEQIRALARQGFARARIAEALVVRYQYVRNVLEHDRPKSTGANEESSPFAPSGFATGEGPIFQFTVEAGGKITLPDQLLALFRVREGRILVGELKGETLELFGPLEGMRRVQAMTEPWKPGEPMLSEELIAERHAEALRE